MAADVEVEEVEPVDVDKPMVDAPDADADEMEWGDEFNGTLNGDAEEKPAADAVKDAAENKDSKESKTDDATAKDAVSATADADFELLNKAVGSRLFTLDEAKKANDAGLLKGLMEKLSARADGREEVKPTPVAPTPDATQSEEKLFTHELSEEDYPDENLRAFHAERDAKVTALNRTVVNEIKPLIDNQVMPMLGSLLEHFAQLTMAPMFAELGDDYRDAVGNGTHAQISKEQLRNRTDVAKLANTLIQTGNAQDFKSAFKMAVDSKFSETAKKNLVAKVEQKAAIEKQALRRSPVQSKLAAPVDPIKKAQADWEDFDRSL